MTNVLWYHQTLETGVAKRVVTKGQYGVRQCDMSGVGIAESTMTDDLCSVWNSVRCQLAGGIDESFPVLAVIDFLSVVDLMNDILFCPGRIKTLMTFDV